MSGIRSQRFAGKVFSAGLAWRLANPGQCLFQKGLPMETFH
jgi:hypothetical protein